MKQSSFTSMRESLHGIATFLVKRTLRTINNRLDDILKNKGCDASNMFDEEVQDNEKEFSDDEAEKEFKKIKKLRKRGDFEEGEIIEAKISGKKRTFNKVQERPKSQYRGSELP